MGWEILLVGSGVSRRGSLLCGLGAAHAPPVQGLASTSSGRAWVPRKSVEAHRHFFRLLLEAAVPQAKAGPMAKPRACGRKKARGPGVGRFRKLRLSVRSAIGVLASEIRPEIFLVLIFSE